jgi:hypothetical protein
MEFIFILLISRNCGGLWGCYLEFTPTFTVYVCVQSRVFTACFVEKYAGPFRFVGMHVEIENSLSSFGLCRPVQRVRPEPRKQEISHVPQWANTAARFEAPAAWINTHVQSDLQCIILCVYMEGHTHSLAHSLELLCMPFLSRSRGERARAASQNSQEWRLKIKWELLESTRMCLLVSLLSFLKRYTEISGHH